MRRRLAGWGAVVLLLGALGYVLYLDITVRSAFEGKRWAVPARVYARSLELFSGAGLSADRLEKELTRLGYRSTASPQRPGEYSRHGEEFLVNTRAFSFWDGQEPARRLRIVFTGPLLRTVQSTRLDQPVPIVRLDPPVIGAIYPTHREDRILVRLDQVPDRLIRGLLAIEDRHFFEHHGIDYKAILRALWANIRALGVVQGASTITQQLVKNFFLTPERTLWRKINEAIMALLLEWHYDKEEILEAYLNEIYLGQRGSYAIHGFGLAARFYFGLELENLDTAQLATLIGLVRGPSYYDPWRFPARARERRDRVLQIMASQGVIGQSEAARLQGQALGIGERPRDGATPFPAYLDLVRRQLRQFYREEDLTSEGLRVFTALDPDIQAAAERAVTHWLERLERQRGMEPSVLEGAVIVTARERGEVQAVVGGRDPRFPGFNRALDASRPIGSLIKPVVYLAALSQPRRYHLMTPLEDTPIRIRGPGENIWSPRNYDGEYHGTVTLREALIHSYNVPVIRVGMEIGMERVLDTLQRLGARRPLNPYPSLFLGAASLSPLEVSQVYQSLADGGFATPLRAIRAVVSADGEPLQRYPLTVERAADPAPTYLIQTVLQEVVQEGTAAGLRSQIPGRAAVAGKTGTTDDHRDSWFAGFTADHVAVAWVGRDDNQATGLTGSSGAMRIWGELISGLKPRPLELLPPRGITWLEIDPASGLIAGRGCRQTVTVPFIEGSGPREKSDCVYN
ncbi:MAG: penicillin-binding protein 1B [Gammaproteobacteria bacterium]